MLRNESLDQYAQAFERLYPATFPLQLSACAVPPSHSFCLFVHLSEISLYLITILSRPLKSSFSSRKMPSILLEAYQKKTENRLKKLGIKNHLDLISRRFKDVLKNDDKRKE